MEKASEFCNVLITSKNFGSDYTYFKLASYCLGYGSSTGRTVSEIRARIKLIDKLEKEVEESLSVTSNPSAAKISLLPDEISLLLKSFLEVKWTIVDKTIPEFEDYINSLNSYDYK